MADVLEIIQDDRDAAAKILSDFSENYMPALLLIDQIKAGERDGHWLVKYMSKHRHLGIATNG